MVKRELSIYGGLCPFLALGKIAHGFETEKTIFESDFYNKESDIVLANNFFKQAETPFNVILNSNQKYRLEITHLVCNKVTNDDLILPKLKNLKYIKEVPTIWFNFNFLKQPFMSLVNDLNKRHKEMEFPEDVLVDEITGKPILVLRPSNMTHSLLAFEVFEPELFRHFFFEQILVEIKQLWKAKRDNAHCQDLIEHINENLLSCGIRPISESTFGIAGAYSDKTEFEPDQWGLSLFIKGWDVRALRVGDIYLMHDDWFTLKKRGQNIIQPRSIEDFTGNTEVLDEIKTVFDNPITLVAGSMDFRLIPGNDPRLYFLETSFSFSLERYSEAFVTHAIEDTLNYLEARYDQLVGDKNDDWEQRRVEYMKLQKETSPLSYLDSNEEIMVKDLN